MTLTEWQMPEVAASDLTYTVTISVLAQLAQGHTVDDILRELVQNEYDAGGSSLPLTFGPAGLEVQGNGHAIDGDGWRLLKLVLGTGQVRTMTGTSRRRSTNRLKKLWFPLAVPDWRTVLCPLGRLSDGA
jgi:hypothetical protein